MKVARVTNPRKARINRSKSKSAATRLVYPRMNYLGKKAQEEDQEIRFSTLGNASNKAQGKDSKPRILILSSQCKRKTRIKRLHP